MINDPSFSPAAKLVHLAYSAATKTLTKCIIAATASLLMVSCDTKEDTSGEEPSPEASSPPLASPPPREKPTVTAPGPSPQSAHDQKKSGTTFSSP